MKREIHTETVPVQVWIDVDKNIADLVTSLNKVVGVRCHASCQGTIGEGGAEPYEPYVQVTWSDTPALSRLKEYFEFEEKGIHWGYVHSQKKLVALEDKI